MIALTARGSLAQAYTKQFKADTVSFRELKEADFLKKLSQADTVIHNASTVECKDLGVSIRDNFDFTRYLVEKLQECNSGVHLVYISSMSVLDPSDDQKYGDVLKMTPYSYSKYLAETFCLLSGLENVSCARFSTLFYGDPKKDGLSRLVHDAVTGKRITIYDHGEARRNFLPLDIAAQYVNKIASGPKRGKKTYNLAAPTSSSFGEVADMLKDIVPGLEVKDKIIGNSVPVLSEFGARDIESLGVIDFSLKERVGLYAKELGL